MALQATGGVWMDHSVVFKRPMVRFLRVHAPWLPRPVVTMPRGYHAPLLPCSAGTMPFSYRAPWLPCHAVTMPCGYHAPWPPCPLVTYYPVGLMRPIVRSCKHISNTCRTHVPFSKSGPKMVVGDSVYSTLLPTLQALGTKHVPNPE